jgi:hypothetical protein
VKNPERLKKSGFENINPDAASKKITIKDPVSSENFSCLLYKPACRNPA